MPQDNIAIKIFKEWYNNFELLRVSINYLAVSKLRYAINKIWNILK